MFKNITNYSLYLLAFLLPWQTRFIIKPGFLNGGYWEYGSFSLYLIDVVLVIILFIFLVSYFFEKNNNKEDVGGGAGPSFIWWVIALLELSVFISIFFSTDKWLAFYGYIRFLLGIGLFWIVSSGLISKTKIILAFFAGSFLSFSLGVWQFIFQSSFSFKWLGLASHNPYELGTSVIEVVNGGRWLRAYGSFDHPNILGAVSALSLLFFIYLIVNNKIKFLEERGVVKNILLYGYLLITFTSLIFSFSRAGWLGFGFGFFCFFVLLFLGRNNFYRNAGIKISLSIFILFIILSGLYREVIYTRIYSEARLEQKSNLERVEYYNKAIETIEDNFIFGVGINNYTLKMYQENNNNPSFYYQPPHNAFLLVLAEVGIFGFIFFIFIFGLLIRGLWINNDYYAIIIILFLMLVMMLDHWWWSLHFGILYFWFIVSLIYNKNTSIK